MKAPNRYSPNCVIIENPGRNQPYTVWRKGKVERFEFTRAHAEAYVAMMTAQRRQRVGVTEGV